MSANYSVEVIQDVPTIIPAINGYSHRLSGKVYSKKSEIILNGHEDGETVIDLWELPHLRMQDSSWRDLHLYPSRLADFNEADMEAFKAEFGVPKYVMRVLSNAERKYRKSNELTV